MKVVLRIFLPICIISFLGFFISLIVLGVNPNDTVNANLAGEITEIQGDYSNIKLTTSIHDIKLYPTNGTSTIIKVNGKALSDVKYTIEDDTLKIVSNKQIRKFTDIFSFDFFDRGEIRVFVPDKQYYELYANVMAGSTEINGVKAADVELTLSAGTLLFANPEGWKNNELNAYISAGSCDIYNAETAQYDFSMSAGEMCVYGLTGEGNIDLNAGDAEVNYKELNGNVNVEASAGDVTLYVPEDASAKITCDRSAGSVTVKHGDANRDLNDDEKVTIGGGEYDIFADISAGSIDIKDEPKEKNAPTIPEAPKVPKAVASTVIDANNGGTPVEDMISATRREDEEVQPIEPVDPIEPIDPIKVDPIKVDTEI